MFAIERKGRVAGADRVLLYGPGGIGKSTLASMIPGAVFIDLEDGSRRLDVQRVPGVDSWDALRAAVRAPIYEGVSSLVIDSATKAEEYATAWAIANVPHEKGYPIHRIEDYGFGKGFQHVYDTFLNLLVDLDQHVRAGRNVVLIAHDVTDMAPNPSGEDFLRYEPAMQSPKSGKASIRNRVFQWADHVLYLGYDVISKDGKGQGSGTRTIFPREMPTHRAKSRSLAYPLPYNDAQDGALWKELGWQHS